MARGGRRKGVPGKNYPNRSDMAGGPRQLPVKAGPSQGYGQRAALEDAQRAIPMGQPAVPTPQPQQQGQRLLGQLPPLDAPTENPNEPITAGLPIGAGPGPEALVTPNQDDEILLQLRAMYKVMPSEDLREVIEDYEQDLR